MDLIVDGMIIDDDGKARVFLCGSKLRRRFGRVPSQSAYLYVRVPTLEGSKYVSFVRVRESRDVCAIFAKTLSTKIIIALPHTGI